MLLNNGAEYKRTNEKRRYSYRVICKWDECGAWDDAALVPYEDRMAEIRRNGGPYGRATSWISDHVDETGHRGRYDLWITTSNYGVIEVAPIPAPEFP